MPRNTILTLTAAIHIIALLFVFSSCKQERRAQKMPESVNAYVYGYTSGTVSIASDIRVRFASITAQEEEIGNEATRNIISFSPAVKGKAIWEDAQTLRFEPDGLMQSGQVYVANVNLSAVFDGLPADAKSFEFDFRTKDQYFQVDVDGIHTVNPQNLEKQEIHGTIYTADVAIPEDIEQVLDAKQGKNNLPVRWAHNTDERSHAFVVEEVNRSAKASLVKLNWNGQKMGLSLKGDKEVEIPALGDFKVVDVAVVTSEGQYIKVHFSDPLMENQDFSGLIVIPGYGDRFRYVAEGNQLRLYPTSNLSGKHNLQVSPGILNAAGSKMPNASTWDIQIQDVKPQVRLVGTGVIMPESDGLVFPFEAVSLNAVEVEVFKIFHNNILQFLQSNTLDGGYDLHRVGRIIMQKKVALQNLNPNGSPSEWTRYALDLSDLIEQDGQAIYQIRIGFKPAYSTYFCSNSSDNNTDDISEISFEEEEGEYQSIMNSWYGPDGYYQGYSYQHRKDPCYSAYYNSDRFVQRNVMASNLGLIAKGGAAGKYMAVVTDLRTTAPISGADVEFYDYQQQLLASATSDADGMVSVEMDREPFVLIAKQGEQRGYLRLKDGDAVSLSRFEVGGARAQKGLKGYIYGERGVWRPGDSVFLNFVLEDKEGTLPPNYPIHFELKDARGQIQIKRVESASVNNVYPLHFATGLDDPTGNWMATVKAGGATFRKNVRIETVKPNRIKVALDFGKERLSIADEPIQGALVANWLHGAPASNLKAKVEAQLRSTSTTFDGYGDFVFVDPARAFSSRPITVFDGELDDKGQQQLSFKLNSSSQVPGKLKAEFKTRVFEKGGDFSTANYTVDYDPFNAYTGIALPRDKYEQKRIEVKKTGKLQFVALSNDGKPLNNKKLSVGVYRVNWRWWWDRSSDNVSRYNSSQHYDAKQTKSLVTNAKGEASWDFTVPEWGRYMVRVCDTESGHCSGDFFYAGYPWYGDDDDGSMRKAASMLAFSADKEKYNVGETVNLNLPEGKNGRALITLENGKKVIDTYWADTKEGENTLSFEVTEEMTPNVYAHVALIQSHAQVENDLPIRMYGVIPVSVEDPNTRLQPEIKIAKELRPEQEFSVEVSEESGKPMAYTIAIVDEGLLGLTNFKTPNPWDAFYAKEALGVKTWDVYDEVLGAYGAELERLLSIGGDGEIRKAEQENRANRFKPVVMHLGPFELKKGKKANHTFTMPNYVGAVRAMVVAADQGAYGSAEQTVPVRQPLMVLATLPRVLSPGEELQLPVSVFAMDKKVKSVSVEVKESTGLVEFTESSKTSLQFNKQGDQLVNFGFRVKDRVGVAKFTILAKGNGEKASQEIELQVRNPNPYVVNVGQQVIEQGQSHQFTFAPHGMPGTNEAILEVSNIPPIDLGNRLNYLIRYPYGCLEQTLSGGFPQLYVQQLLELSEEQEKEVPVNIQAAIDRLRNFQTSLGGFAYWPGSSGVNHWSNSYAGHFLLEAKALGYSVPASMLEKWMQYQKKSAKLWKADAEEVQYGFYYNNDRRALMQAYRLFTLALAGEPELSAMNRLRTYKDLGVRAKWRLAAAYALAGKKEVAQELIKGAKPDVEEYRDMGYTYGSRLRDRAMILETYVILDDKGAGAPIVQYISDEMSSQRWLSTQETAFALLAIGKYVGKGDAKSKLAFSYQLDNGKTVDAGSNLPIMQISLPVQAGNTHAVSVKNESGGVLFTKVIRSGQPLAGEETASASHLKIDVAYLDMDGRDINPAYLSQGTDFMAKVVVSHPGDRPFAYEELALNQVFPSGWEIINTRMDNIQAARTSSRAEYQDIRDDRVNTFFDLRQGKSDTYYIQLNAAYQGRFYLPAVSCEAMYDNSINARVPGQWVEVTGPRNI